MMTEKELLVSMVKRVFKDNSLGNFWIEEENGDFSIFNQFSEKTTFMFDLDGNLEWFG